MKTVYLLALSIFLLGCTSLPNGKSDYFGLTQAQFAAKVGYPLKVQMLPSTAQGGPGILFWVYYQRSPSGEIEEQEIAFDMQPLRVSSVPADFAPLRLLSLDKATDIQAIYKYNAAHGQ